MTKVSLRKIIADAINANQQITGKKAAVAELAKEIEDTLAEHICQGDTVCIGVVGSLKAVDVPSHNYRNIKTGKLDTHPAHSIVRFRQSIRMKALVNE